VPVAAQTAWHRIFTHGHPERGQTILIHGGAGAVGAQWAGNGKTQLTRQDSCFAWPRVLGGEENMAERIHELLLRNLQEVFGEGDPAKRRSAIKELYTDDCVLYVPPGTFVGHDALDKFAGDLRATHPHFAYAPHAAPQALHNSGRLKWGSGPRGGVPAYTGEDVIIVRDGRIAALYVFLDAPPA